MMNTTTNALRSAKPFGWKDRLSYMMGDLGNDFTFIMMAAFLMLFYTEVLKIAPAMAGLILVGARVWDAFADVTAGLFIDARKPGKWGKFRPFLIFGALPVTIMGVLTFTQIPGLTPEMTVVWAAATYILWGTAYSFINIPYGSLASVVTEDPVHRTSLSTWRNIGALVANSTITAVAPLFIFANGGKPTAAGFLTVMILFTVAAVVSYLLAWAGSTERIPAAKAPKLEIRKSLKGLIRNRPLIGLMLTSFSLLIAQLTTSTLNAYLFKDFFANPKLVSLVGPVTLTSTVLVILGIQFLVKRIGKKETAVIGISVSALFYFVQFLFPVHDPYIFLGLLFVSLVGLAMLNVLIWALVADAIDYQELLTHKREEGIVYSLYSFMRKMGQAVAGGFGAFVLASVGYVSGAATQNAQVANGVRDAVTLIPAVCMTISLVCLLFVYNLSKPKLAKMVEELHTSREERGL
ncbi:MAG: glycoside-pentoside-hexuronide (GPH):cation symporter [Spirochaetales bacterium]